MATTAQLVTSIQRFVGSSASVKPSEFGSDVSASAVKPGSEFWERDTGRTYLFVDGAWTPTPGAFDAPSSVANLLAEQNLLLRQVVFGLSKLTDLDLASVEV